jgi:hypothetical protein
MSQTKKSNFNTNISNNQINSNDKLFQDKRNNIIVHYKSCSDFKHKALNLEEAQNEIASLRKKFSEAQLQLDKDQQEFILPNDKLITNLQFDQIDLYSLRSSRRGLTEGNINISSNQTTQRNKFTKNNNTKYKPLPKYLKIPKHHSFSIDNSNNSNKSTKQKTNSKGMRNNKSNITTSNSKVKNFAKFVNKPFNGNKTLDLTQNNIIHSSATSISTTSSVKKPERLPTRHKSVNYNNKKIMGLSSIIKNSDKMYRELQILFGQNLQNVEHIYTTFTDDDKRNLITSLLGFINEMKHSETNAKTQINHMKKELDSKNKMIANTYKEITKLKKDNEKKSKQLQMMNGVNKKERSTSKKTSLSNSKYKVIKIVNDDNKHKSLTSRKKDP